MVTVYREPIGYAEGWRYEIVANVPHDWASHKFSKISGYGHASLTTAYEGITYISLNDTDPKFKDHLAWIIAECTDMENKKIGQLETQINELQLKRETLIKKNRGKHAKLY